MNRLRLRRRLIWLLCAVFVLGGCRARATVSVRVDDSGAGEVIVRVALDRSAVEAVVGLGDSLDEAVRLDGLADSGWKIEPWAIDGTSGRAVVVLRKSFGAPAEIESVLRELGGELIDVSVEFDRSRGVLTSRDALRIEVDAKDLAVRVADDPVLSERLAAAGYDIDSGDAALTKQLSRSLRIDVRASVAGHEDTVELAAGDSGTVEVGREATNWGRLTAALLALAAVILGLPLLFFALRR